MQITTVLTKAEPRIVNRRDGSGSFTLYELFDHEGTAWVVKQDVYEQWAGAIGQTVDMIVRVEQNGQWTNRYADLIQLSQAGAQVPASNAVQQAFQAAQAAQRVQPTVPQTPNTLTAQQGAALLASGQATQIQDVSVFPTRKDDAIFRQTAAKVAATISDDPAQFWANVQDLAHYFATGQTPSASMAPDQPATAGYAYADSDVPFGKTAYSSEL